MKKKHILLLSLILVCGYSLKAQEAPSPLQKLTAFVANVNTFAEYIPQEKVYLHFDNTSYYLGDAIWFKGYVVNSNLLKASNISSTLYVELLSPEGDIVSTKKLKIVDGQCSGDFLLKNDLATGSLYQGGFYEIRAYTRYMLNFGDECIFSRVLPVYDQPKIEGGYETKKMTVVRRPISNLRKKPAKLDQVNIEFYPESGNLVTGIESRIAFKATNKNGTPIEVTGTILNEKKEQVAELSTQYLGMGTCMFRPQGGKHTATINYEGKTYTANLPPSAAQGYTMQIDNSEADSISVFIQKSTGTTSEVIGLVTASQGQIISFSAIDLNGLDECRVRLAKEELPSGVAQAILYTQAGLVLSDRLFFVKKNNNLSINILTDKKRYSPYEKVNLDVAINDAKGSPVNTTFSLAVTDIANETRTQYSDNILTNMLLSSDIKGFIENPSYYFEKDDAVHRANLDLLLLTQGWRRYVWKTMAGLTPFDLKHAPEKGILIDGSVTSFVLKKKKENIEVSIFLTKEGDEKEVIVTSCKTDSLGKFTTYTDIQGQWQAVLQTKEKDKQKTFNVLLNRTFSPAAKTYSYYDTALSYTNRTKLDNKEGDAAIGANVEALPDDTLAFYEKIHELEGVTITEKRKYNEKEENLASSAAIYDARKELDAILDRGDFVGDKNIYEFLAKLNSNFMVYNNSNGQYFKYKNKEVLFAVNDYASIGGMGSAEGSTPFESGGDISGQNVEGQMRGDFSVMDIESIAISESENIISKAFYRSNPGGKMQNYGAVVFIYTYNDGIVRIPRKGIRRARVDGYAYTTEFYNINYDILPKDPDYRRTLYWNPNVSTDEAGKVKLSFFNNSTAKQLHISAETITADGMLGVLKED